jgi:hypothetical protein
MTHILVLERHLASIVMRSLAGSLYGSVGLINGSPLGKLRDRFHNRSLKHTCRVFLRLHLHASG